MEEFNNKYVHLRYKNLETQQQKNTTFLDDENICPVCTFSPILIAQNTNVFTFTQTVYFHFFQSMLPHTQLIVKVTKENYISKHKSVFKSFTELLLGKNEICKCKLHLHILHSAKSSQKKNLKK